MLPLISLYYSHGIISSSSFSEPPISPCILIWPAIYIHIHISAYSLRLSSQAMANANCNPQIAQKICTFETCCLAQSTFHYIPSWEFNLFFAIFFGAFILPQIGLGIVYRTWGFAVGMTIGLALEIVGYVARVQIRDSPFDDDPLLVWVLALL